MPNQILLDNWTLQEISKLELAGLSNIKADKLEVDIQRDTHSYLKISHGFVQLQALFSFLQNLVLRETIITDGNFVHVWNASNSLNKIESDGIIKTHNFKEEKIKGVREAIVEQLCITTSIRETQQQNQQEWAKSQKNVDQFMSQLIWGGAGMLARSHVYETFYLPHPLRGYAIEQSPIAKRDAFTETISFISTNQTKLLYFDYKTSEAIQAKFVLPPLISTIIEESNSFDDLFVVALQLRKDYENLRLWLKKFQEDIDTDNSKGILKQIKTLESIQKNIEAKYNPDKFGSLEIGFNILSLSPSVSIPFSLNSFKNKIGIRSTINDLILKPAGNSSVKKLLKLLGEKNTKLGKLVYDELIRSFQDRKNKQ